MWKIIKDFFHFLFWVIIVSSIVFSWFIIWREIVIKHFNLTKFSTAPIVVLNREKEIKVYEIVDKYIYLTNKKFYVYKRVLVWSWDQNSTTWNNIKQTKKYKIVKKIVNKLELTRDYTQQNNKIKYLKTLYDYMSYNWNVIDLRTDLMNQIDLLNLLNEYNVWPYFDKKNNTLYIFAHSSWKLYNLWKIFFKMKKWDKIIFFDNQWQLYDTYKIVERKIVKAKDFENKYFLTFKNKIVLVTCYPFNSTSHRLFLVLKKINSN